MSLIRSLTVLIVGLSIYYGVPLVIGLALGHFILLGWHPYLSMTLGMTACVTYLGVLQFYEIGALIAEWGYNFKHKEG